MAIIKETFIDFTTLGTPSAGHFYLGFDLDGLPKYKNPAGEVHEFGGSGGTVSGTPSYIAYFDVDGNISGDTGFVRGSMSTYIVSSEDDYTLLYGQGNVFDAVTGSATIFLYGDESVYFGFGDSFISEEIDERLGGSSSVNFSYHNSDGHQSYFLIGHNCIVSSSTNNNGTMIQEISPEQVYIGSTLSVGTQSSIGGLLISPDIIPAYGIRGAGIIGSATDGSIAVNGVVDLSGGFGKQINTPAMGYFHADQQTTMVIGTYGSQLIHQNFINSQNSTFELGYDANSSHVAIDMSINGPTFSGGLYIDIEGTSLVAHDQFNDNNEHFLRIGTQSISMGGTSANGTHSVGFYFGKGPVISGITGMGILASASDGSVAINGIIMTDGGLLNSPTIAYLSNNSYGTFIIGTDSVSIAHSNSFSSEYIRLKSDALSIFYSVESGTYSSIYLDGFGVYYSYFGSTFSLPTSYGASGSIIITDDSGNLTFSTVGVSATYSTGDGTIVTLVNGIVTSIV